MVLPPLLHPFCAVKCSNTNVSLFKAYGEACKAFGGPDNPSIAHLLQLPQNQGCQLGLAQDLITSLTDRLRSLPNVNSVQGRVTQIEQVCMEALSYSMTAAHALCPSSSEDELACDGRKPAGAL